MLNRHAFNLAQFNLGVVPAGDADAPSLAPSLGVPFRFEVYSRAGAFLASVLNWRGGNREISPNAPSTMSIEVAADDESAEHLVFPNEVWLWRGEHDEVWEKYKILATRQRRDGAGNWIIVEAESLLGDLGRETVTAYETPTSEDEDGNVVIEKATVRNIMGSLLAFQTQSPTIRLGTMDASIGNTEIAIKFQNKSILSCIAELRRIVGGYFWVDTNRVLRWRRTIGYERGHWLRLDHNLGSVEVYTDYRQIKTRYLGRGAGFTNETRLESQADDAGAQAEYGVIVGTVYQSRVNDQDTLDAMTEAELARYASPAVSYRMGVIDLSMIDPSAYSFEALMLTPGTEVNVLCDDPAIDIACRVRRVKWDLADPAHVEVEFSNPLAGSQDWGGNDGTHEQDLVDRVVDLVERAEEVLSDNGFAETIDGLMDPPIDTPSRIWTDENAGTRAADLTEVPYNVADPTEWDRFMDAVMDRLIDALSDETHPKYNELREVIGASGENNVWVPYGGS